MGVFTLLVACGLGVPLPEDIALITGGFLAAKGPAGDGVGSVWAMMLVGLVGILTGDSIIFKAGKDYGDALLETRLGRHIPPQRVERVRELFVTHGSKLIMLARFVPGLRAVTYFVAGTSRVRYLVFVMYDGIAALVSAPAWVWLGYWMGRQHAIRRAFAMAQKFQLFILIALAVAGLSAAAFWWVSRRREAERRALRLLKSDAGRPKSGPISPAPRPGVERA